MFPERPVEPVREPVRTWLYFVAFLIFCLVLIGGATRLTDSGLSITEWKPILGIIPPLNEADWLLAFSKYQQIPEYKLQNAGMSLQDFKTIFWWEWAHRFLARLVGIAFVVPMIWFAIRGRLGRSLWPSLLLLLALGAAQGGLGWFMVHSGLTERVDVSQYRLSAHLTLASIIFAAIIWVGLGIGRQRQRPFVLADYVSLGLVMLMMLQIAAGGFVAGIDAGMGYNTWPKMDGAWIPEGLAVMKPAWRNLFENALTVQFQHRLLAYIILAIACWHAWQSFSLSAISLLYVVFAQAVVGVTTLMLQAPIAIALVHQAMALVVLFVAVWNLHSHLIVSSSPVQDQL
jgi:heme a synthase